MNLPKQAGAVIVQNNSPVVNILGKRLKDKAGISYCSLSFSQNASCETFLKVLSLVRLCEPVAVRRSLGLQIITSSTIHDRNKIVSARRACPERCIV